MKRYQNIRQISDAKGIPVRTLRSLYQSGKISGYKFGHRTLLFDPQKVDVELAKFEKKALC